MMPCVEPLPLYRPRDPRVSDLWRLMNQHFETFQRVYDERFAAKYGFWRPIIERSVTAFLRCGDLHEGFARVRCPDCQHEMFVAYKYMTRCPFSLSRLVKVTQTGQVIYKAEKDACRHFPDPQGDGMTAGPKRNFQVLEPLEFIAEFTQHRPSLRSGTRPKGAHLIRYYGWYSNKARGMRRKAVASSSSILTTDHRPLTTDHYG
jgi:hypothetical protein